MVNKNSNQGPWWKQGVQIFSEVSTWIFVPIILALIAGKALDNRYGTKPLWLLILAGVGFLVSAYGITKAIRKFSNEIQPPKSPLSGGTEFSPPAKGERPKGEGVKDGLNQK